MSPFHHSFSIRPFSSNSKEFSLVGQYSNRRSLHCRRLPPRKQRSLPSLVERRVALAKVHSLVRHSMSANIAQYHQTTMPSNSAPHREDFIGQEQTWDMSGNDAVYTDYIYAEPYHDEELDQTCEFLLASGSISTVSSGSSPFSSTHSASTDESVHAKYTPDLTYDQGIASNGGIPIQPAGNPPPRTPSGSSAEAFFVCRCGREIQHRRNVKRHIKHCKLTKNKEEYQCEFCGDLFAREDNRDRHRDGDGMRDSACWVRISGSEVCFYPMPYLAKSLGHFLTIFLAQ